MIRCYEHVTVHTPPRRICTFCSLANFIMNWLFMLAGSEGLVKESYKKKKIPYQNIFCTTVLD